ncbi:hypothetical protein GCK32_015655 [Trichostrongylus colubriformis]|uniref:Uncharacterized protein n=1 Tax=Trichostrongylus colubriformis TaxID=6319 RepID=A0AAN8ILM0_TRICO
MSRSTGPTTRSQSRLAVGKDEPLPPPDGGDEPLPVIPKFTEELRSTLIDLSDTDPQAPDDNKKLVAIGILVRHYRTLRGVGVPPTLNYLPWNCNSTCFPRAIRYQRWCLMDDNSHPENLDASVVSHAAAHERVLTVDIVQQDPVHTEDPMEDEDTKFPNGDPPYFPGPANGSAAPPTPMDAKEQTPPASTRESVSSREFSHPQEPFPFAPSFPPIPADPAPRPLASLVHPPCSPPQWVIARTGVSRRARRAYCFSVADAERYSEPLRPQRRAAHDPSAPSPPPRWSRGINRRALRRRPNSPPRRKLAPLQGTSGEIGDNIFLRRLRRIIPMT